jgi:putative addiction module component (TIGR02574 family)
MRLEEIPNFKRMTDIERLELAEDLLASVDLEKLPSPLSHRLELENRWREFERDPGIGLTENEFWAKVHGEK